MNFRKELTELVNEYHMEKYSNTPDFLLAEFLENVLMAFDISVNNREKHYGRKEVKDEYELPVDHHRCVTEEWTSDADLADLTNE